MLTVILIFVLSLEFLGNFVNNLKEIIFTTIIIAIIFIDIISLLASGILLLILSRKLSSQEVKKFNEEKQRFWKVLFLLLIMTITWTSEFIIWKSRFYFLFKVSILIDFLKVFGAINIFVVFINKNFFVFKRKRLSLFIRETNS